MSGVGLRIAIASVAACAIFVTPVAAAANCKLFLADNSKQQADAMFGYELYVAGFVHASDLSCTVAEAEMMKRKSPEIAFLAKKDCAGRERGLKFSRLALEDRAQLVRAACQADPNRALERAVLETIVDLR